jgi:hypothetical protein
VGTTGVFRAALRRVLLCGGLLFVAGCASISLGDPQVAKTPTGETTRETVHTNLYVASVRQDGAIAWLRLDHACDTVEKRILAVRTTRERHNDWAAFDWGMFGGGVALGTLGAVTIIDANDVYGNQKDQRTFNSVGQTNARLAGAGIAAVGAALIAIPTIDAIRASGSTVTESMEPEPAGKTIAAGVACKGEPVHGLAVRGRIWDGGGPAESIASELEPARKSGDSPFGGNDIDLGTIEIPGRLTIDLASVDSERWLLGSRGDRLDVMVGTQRVASLDLGPARAAIDDRHWDASSSSECADPRSLTACDGVAAYLRQLPDGKHAREASELTSGARPKLAALKDHADWVAAQSESCREPKDEHGCDGVQRYLDEHDAGLHAGDARDVLTGSAGKIAQLRARAEAEAKAAERKAAAEAAAEKRREEAEERRQRAEALREAVAAFRQCKQTCRDRCVMQYRDDEKLEACARICVRADCNTPDDCPGECRDQCIIEGNKGQRRESCARLCRKEQCGQ